MCNNDDWAKASFLLSKWTHHDNLIYKRVAQFYTMHGIVLTISTIIINIVVSSTEITRFHGCYIIGTLLLFSGYLTWTIFKMKHADIIARNSFNKEIVNTIHGKVAEWHSPANYVYSNWYPGNAKHPINSWHLYNPVNDFKSGTASVKKDKTFLFTLCIELVTGALLIFNAYFKFL